MHCLKKQANALNCLAENHEPPPIVVQAFNNAHRIVFVGIGKSFHVAGLAADTFASLGINSLSLNAADVLHGNSGYIQDLDCVVFISKSGATDELIASATCISNVQQNVDKVVMSCSEKPKPSYWPEDVLWYDITNGVGVEELNGYSPTVSTLMFIAVLNQWAMTNQQFNEFQFRSHHPGGTIGAEAKEQA